MNDRPLATVLPIIIIVVFFCSLSFSIGFGQPMIPRQYQNKSPIDYRQLEKSYSQWLQSTSAEERSRWKYYSRWIEEAARQTDADGQLVGQDVLFREARRVQNIKEDKSQRKIRESNWLPLGPADMPAITQDFMITGKGRINTMAFHPTDPETMFVGTSQGGVWKTTNNGKTWSPISDQLPILRISDIAINPHDPQQIYVSVGDMAYVGIALETDNRKRNTHYGLGVYKTNDGGESWFPTGLTFDQLEKDFSITRRVFIHPDNTERLVAAGFHGIWVSDNGGTDWTQTNELMIWDIEQDPVNPDILYSSSAYVANLGRDEAGVLKSKDFGVTWESVSFAIPVTPSVQRIELAIAPQDPNMVYALACNLNGGLYGVFQTLDGGENWDLRASQPNILQWSNEDNNFGQGTYDLTILVDPVDKNKIYTGGVNMWMSEDAGENWSGVSYYTQEYGASIHADQHFLTSSPHTGEIYMCNDGGVFRSSEILPGSWETATTSRTYSWPTTWEQITGGVVNTSFYRLSTSNINPEHVFAGAQDLGTFYNQSGQWEYNIFGDGMECIIHPENDQILYGSTQFGSIQKSTDGGKNFKGIVASIPIWRGELPAWTAPLMLDPNNPELLYLALSNVWYSENGGDNWQTLPAMTNQFPISAMAISATDPTAIYVAKRIYHSENQPSEIYRLSGSTWLKRDQGLPGSLYPTYLAIDDDNPNLVWVSYAGFEDGQKVYMTTSGGLSWTNISKNLPNIPVNTIVQHADIPSNPIYIGTDVGIYYTNDDMKDWELYSDDLPNVIVTELEINESNQKLIASTFGRGIWINDLVDQLSTSNERIILDQIDVKIYPNPLQQGEELRFDFHLDQPGQLLLHIRDVMGRKIYSEQLRATAGKFEKSIELNALSGIYFFVLESGNSKVSRKFAIH